MTSINKEIIIKGWGYEEVLINTELYCSKILHINRDKCLSWHFHNLKDETFYVENGKVLLYSGWEDDILTADIRVLSPGDTFNVPVGLRHRLKGLENSRVFEFSTQHFDEDSIRLIKGD